MALSKKISNYLDSNKYKYEVIEHRTTYTAWDTAQTEKVKPQEVGKALVMMADKDCVLALIPSNKNVDKKKLLKLINVQRKKAGEKVYLHTNKSKNISSLNPNAKIGVGACKKIEFAKEAWMKKNIIGKVGATPPFMGLLGVPVYCDKLLAKNKKIYLGSGEYTESIRVTVRQYLKIEKPTEGSFSMKKQ